MTVGKFRMHFTFKGQILFSFWIDRTGNKSLSMGPVIDGSDLHLTFFEQNQKIRYHVRHKGLKEPSDESPISAQKSTQLVGTKVMKLLKRRLIRYNGNKTCWVLTPERLKKLQTALPTASTGGDIYVPIEIAFAELETDFSEKDKWQKRKIRTLLDAEPHFGFIILRGGRMSMIVPLSQNQLLTWPLQGPDSLFNYLSGVTGVKEFFDYFWSTEEGRKLAAETRRRIRELSK